MKEPEEEGEEQRQQEETPLHPMNCFEGMNWRRCAIKGSRCPPRRSKEGDLCKGCEDESGCIQCPVCTELHRGREMTGAEKAVEFCWCSCLRLSCVRWAVQRCRSLEMHEAVGVRGCPDGLRLGWCF
ncbi:unnamed protein product [Symbiodinium natans]|uniref:Uncharacterized protein n=1 Tax=Symbiodinium natans TaxID=878477 RepID=A0A812S049_9DINO|nr:unnamed protein product [Symbiodinium natans]